MYIEIRNKKELSGFVSLVIWGLANPFAFENSFGNVKFNYLSGLDTPLVKTILQELQSP